MNSQLWHACAGPMVSLPPVGSLVVYFPQGHNEQVAASMQKDTHNIPSYPNLPFKLIYNQADAETDEVYAQMTLQSVNKYDQTLVRKRYLYQTWVSSKTDNLLNSFAKLLPQVTPSPMDFSMQPPAQALVARDLHDQSWTFRHIYRGQPKRHLLTTRWSIFVSSKRLFAGDALLFVSIWKAFVGNTHSLDSIWKETGQDCNSTRRHSIFGIQFVEMASQILVMASKLSRDGVKDFGDGV
ncbi:auxin response factor 19 [Tanacetum coccineum]